MTWVDGIERALVVAAHPDDEVLGCGGLIARLTASGREVAVLILSGITTSRGPAGALPDERSREFDRAMEVLGVRRARRLDLPDNRLDTLPLLHLVRAVEDERTFDPQLVVTHSPSDLNVDHRLTHQATVTAFRPTVGTRWPRVMSFEVPSSTEFQDPNVAGFRPTSYVDISAHLERKLAAMKCYVSELRETPHPRSLAGIAARAQLRGFEACVAHAEAFQLVRELG